MSLQVTRLADDLNLKPSVVGADSFAKASILTVHAPSVEQCPQCCVKLTLLTRGTCQTNGSDLERDKLNPSFPKGSSLDCLHHVVMTACLT